MPEAFREDLFEPDRKELGRRTGLPFRAGPP